MLRFPHKRIRAQVIKDYIDGQRVVCFSCGNAAAALQDIGVDTLHIGEKGDLTPNRWFTQADIKKAFPQHFDATSGHLPIELMNLLSAAYKKYLGDLPPVVYLPTGSGETLVCLKMAYPNTRFVAVYNLDDSTRYDKECPLNDLVKALAYEVIINPAPL